MSAITHLGIDLFALLERIEANAPTMLLELPVWLLHRDKRPIYADGTPRRGKLDAPEDRARLVTFKQIEAALLIHGADGVGIALGPIPGADTALCGIDLDDCYTVDGLTVRAQEILSVTQSYAEKSPSGKGLHVLGFGDISTTKVKTEFGGLEIYSAGRYFTVTGHAVNTFGIADIAEPAALARSLFVHSPPRTPAPVKDGPTTIIEGGRNNFLISEAGKLQRIGLDPLALSAAMHKLNQTRCRPPLLDSEVETVVRSIVRYPPHHISPKDPRAVTLLRATEIRPEPISWLWSGWLARGKLHILAGAPGCGKTTIALKFAATLTTGGTWPDGSHAPISSVLIWSGEDDPKDTLLPRLLAMGADPSRIFFVRGAADANGKARPFDPAQDMDSLRAEALKVGNIGFMIVDPIVNAVAGDSHKNSETRRSLQPIVDLAEQLGAAVHGISHYTKGTQGRDPIERVTGSIAFAAVARIIMGAAKVLRDDGGTDRILVRAKSNIGPDGSGYAYTLDQVELPGYQDLSASAVLWGPSLDGSAQKLLSNAESAGDGAGGASLREALSLLRTELAGGRVPSKELKGRARDAGISDRTLKRAKHTLGVVATKDGATGAWYSELPPEFEEIGQEGQDPSTSNFGPLGPLPLSATPSVEVKSSEGGQGGQQGQYNGVAPLAQKERKSG